MQERVSIAIATYNGARFLREQLDSLCSQSRLPDEIIVCDDNSTDNTVKILEEYHKKGILTYYVNETNLGVNGNFLKAISLCKGDYIAICDQDDVWLPHKIEKSLNKIREIEGGDYAVVFSAKNDIDADGNILRIKKPIKDYCGYSRTLLSPIETCQGCSLLINRKLADYVLEKYYQNPFNMDYLIYDAFISFTGALIGRKYDIGEPLLLYRHHNLNVLGKKQDKMSLREHLSVQNKYRGFIPDVRFDSILKIYDMIKDDIIKDDIQCIIKKIKRINNSKSLTKGLFIIMTINEIPLLDRFKILIGSYFVQTMKCCFLK